ncbi:MAG: hypothetical protein M4D80_17645 [Myxococcota bacterium]|nr:hypothetical protein [Deltaproteobacteria bacterium]MDQ3336988.1 hypothetical protein [Myxococcota bacterium]
MLTGAIIGCVVVLVMVVMNKSKAKAGTGLPGQIEEVLRTSGPLNLKDISVRVGKDSFMGRGNVAQALGALESVGKIKTNPAPDGTPQLKKVDFITYEAVGEKPN